MYLIGMLSKWSILHDEPRAPLNCPPYIDVPICNTLHYSYVQIGAISCLVKEEKQCEANGVIWKSNPGDLGPNHRAH